MLYFYLVLNLGFFILPLKALSHNSFPSSHHQEKKIINYKFMQAVILCGGLGTRLKNKYRHIISNKHLMRI